ncbi:MAG TPA: hypothetical protein VF981_10415 [Gemmatimonadaceae bacterium]
MTAPRGSTSEVATRGAVTLIAAIMVLALPALFDASAVQEAAALHELARGSSPYWQPSHALLLYLRAPAVMVSSAVLLLAPGLLLSAATGIARTPGSWLLSGFAMSLFVVSPVTALVQAVTGRSVAGNWFGALVVLCAVPGMIALLLRSCRVHRDPMLHEVAPGRRATLLLLLPPLLLVACLAPKFFWESFNGDGAHAFESTRLLLSQPVPFWPDEAGPVSAFPGVTSMLFTYPGSWFIRLLGPVEAAVRAPFVLYLVLLVAVVGEFLEPGSRRGDRPWAWIWWSLGGFVLAMSYSATYNPYSADIALPATQDTLLLVCFLAFVLAFLRGERFWLVCWAVLCYLSLPSGVILLAMWTVGAVLVMRPVKWPTIRLTALTIAGCFVGGAVVTRALPFLGLPTPGGEYGLVGILRYFAFLQITDWHRFLYAAVPGGLLPAAATLAWKRQDEASRALTLVAWLYFAFFFVQANVSLHHFVPAMILPLVVFWRMLPREGSYLLRGAVGVSGALGVALTVPSVWAPHLAGRDVGAAVAGQIGGYETSNPEVFAASSLLGDLFPPDWDPSVPASYGGSPLVWNHYARRDGSLPDEVNYLLTRPDTVPPAGWSLARGDASAVLFVRDSTVLETHRAMQPRTDVGAPLLRVPRWVLFRSVPSGGGPAVLDVVRALENAGLDLDPLLRRLGVQR